MYGVIVWLVIQMISARSYKQMESVAYAGYCEILEKERYKGSDFRGPVVTTEEGDILVFRWDGRPSSGDSLSIYVDVPPRWYQKSRLYRKSQTGKLDLWELLSK
jgi:hypothetical protein